MTQAYNLAILANAVDTSGRLNVGTNATGTLPVANGGTGSATLAANNVLLGNGTSALQAVAPSTSGNVLTSNGTTWVSQAPAGGGVTSLNGQTGAITNTTFNAIGSYSPLYVDSTNNAVYAPGSTLAGSSLRVRTGAGLDPDNFVNPFVDTVVGQAENPNLSGTWRAMARSKNQAANFNNIVCPNLWVRIS